MSNKGHNISDSFPQESFFRECFFLDNLGNYFYEPNPQHKDLLSDIKQLIAQYSAGISLVEIDEFMDGFLNQNYQSFSWDLSKKDQYFLAVEFASYIYLRRDTVEYDSLLELVPQDKDRFIRYIGSLDIELDLNLPIMQTAPYIHLMGFILHDVKKAEYLDRFLLQFYQSLNPSDWFDSHLRDTSRFFGYWSFAYGAFVLKNKILDVSFVDHMFYPRDLLGKKLLPTWEDSYRGEKARRKKQDIVKSFENSPEWLNFSKIGFIERAIPKELEKVLQEQEELLFSQAFIYKLRKVGDGGKQVEQYEDPDQLKALITEFANEIIHSTEKQEEIATAFSEELIKNHLAEKLENSYAAMPKELRDEIELYFKTDEAKEIIEKKTVNYKELGEGILHLDEKYESDNEQYWDSLEDLMKTYNIMSPSIPEEKIKDDINKQIKSNLKKRIGKVNFNISLKDYL